MKRIKPISLDLKYGLILGLVTISTVIFGTISQWKDFYELFVPNGQLLNWRLCAFLLVFTILTVWYIMNFFWQKEYNQHEITKMDRDNLKDALKISENERLTDVITGIPNSRSL